MGHRSPAREESSEEALDEEPINTKYAKCNHKAFAKPSAAHDDKEMPSPAQRTNSRGTDRKGKGDGGNGKGYNDESSRCGCTCATDTADDLIDIRGCIPEEERLYFVACACMSCGPASKSCPPASSLARSQSNVGSQDVLQGAQTECVRVNTSPLADVC